MRAHLVPFIAALSLTFALLAPAAEARTDCRSCTLSVQLVQQEDDLSSQRRIIELEDRIDALNTEIRGISPNWPARYIVIGYAGYVAAPLGLLYGGMSLAFGLISVGTDAALGGILIAVGVTGLLVGIAGIAAIIYAWTHGSAVAEEARQRRQGLIDERQRLQRELDRERSRDPSPSPSPPLVQVLTF